MSKSNVVTLEQMALAKQDNFPVQIFVHHTGGTDAEPLMDTSHHGFDVIQSWHIGKGWENIGYHYVIEKDGKRVAGRPETYHAAAVVGHNNDSISICLSGNFDLTLPTEAQELELAKLLHELCLKWNIPAKKIYPHRHAANKTCYGEKLSDLWASDLAMNYKFTAEVPNVKEVLPPPTTPIINPVKALSTTFNGQKPTEEAPVVMPTQPVEASDQMPTNPLNQGSTGEKKSIVDIIMLLIKAIITAIFSKRAKK